MRFISNVWFAWNGRATTASNNAIEDDAKTKQAEQVKIVDLILLAPAYED